MFTTAAIAGPGRRNKSVAISRVRLKRANCREALDTRVERLVAAQRNDGAALARLLVNGAAKSRDTLHDYLAAMFCAISGDLLFQLGGGGTHWPTSWSGPTTNRVLGRTSATPMSLTSSPDLDRRPRVHERLAAVPRVHE